MPTAPTAPDPASWESSRSHDPLDDSVADPALQKSCQLTGFRASGKCSAASKRTERRVMNQRPKVLWYLFLDR